MSQRSETILTALRNAGDAGLKRQALRYIARTAPNLDKALKELDGKFYTRVTPRGGLRYFIGTNPGGQPATGQNQLTAAERRRLDWLDRARALGVTPAVTATVDEIKQLVKEAEREKQKQAVAARRAEAGAEFIGRVLEEAKKTKAVAWTHTRRPKLPKHSTYAMATLSDVHGDETVFPEQIDGLNGHDREISFRRLDNFFNNTIELAEQWLGDLIQYDGIVVPMLGDMVTGYIHEELRETNQHRIFKTVFDYGKHIVGGLIMLTDHFPVVRVPCVVGNHGRLDKKPRHKFAVQDSFDWAMYQFMSELVRAAGKADKIQFVISDSPDLRFSVYDTRFMATHGDQFRGGKGISGIYTPLMIGDARKRRREARVKRSYDWLLMGHWHQLIFGTSFIVNGSVIGYNEFAFDNNLEYDEPKQAFCLIDSEHGLTIRAPIHVKDETESWEVDSSQFGG